MRTVLIVEDEPDLASLLQQFIENAGMNTHIIDNGLEPVDWIKQHTPDIVILDLMLPGKEGIQICQEVRAFSDIPIIITTAKVDELDRLIGFETGANDYICKPYSAKEVIARINSLIKIYNRDSHVEALLVLDNNRCSIRLHDQEIELSNIEFNLLSLLYHHPGRIYNRESIITLIYQDYRIVSDRTVDSHIKNLRKKLSTLSNGTEYIRSIYGIGYKYDG